MHACARAACARELRAARRAQAAQPSRLGTASRLEQALRGERGHRICVIGEYLHSAERDDGVDAGRWCPYAHNADGRLGPEQTADGLRTDRRGHADVRGDGAEGAQIGPVHCLQYAARVQPYCSFATLRSHKFVDMACAQRV